MSLKIIHLCGFIERLNNDHEVKKQFNKYLQRIEAEENSMCDSVCENCGQPAEYDPDYIICKKCKAAVGLST